MNTKQSILSLLMSIVCMGVSSVSAVDSTDSLLPKLLNNSKLSGYFTTTGKEKPPAKESYEILSVVKAPGDNDLWIFTARMKKGGQQVDLPIPLPVKWAGKKPVIYMDNLKIPGLGQFSAFVLFDGDKYAGTWAHGKTTGHLYGTISQRE